MEILEKFPIEEAIELLKNSSPTSSIYVGCDSLPKGKYIDWIVVLVIHFDSNRGGTYKFGKFRETSRARNMGMKERLWREVEMVAEVALALEPYIGERKFEVHLDLSPDKVNKSNTIITEAIGYITALGFQAVVKPDSFAASSVADMRVRK